MSFDIKIDKQSSIPIGAQVREQIKLLVNSGVYKEGDKLPSIGQFAGALGINKNTIVTVFKELERDEYLESFRGKGVFVCKRKGKKSFDAGFIDKVDRMILEAKEMNFSSSELINLINIRYSSTLPVKGIRGLFAIGLSPELVDVNVHKLKQNIPGVKFEGVYLDEEDGREKFQEALQKTDFAVIPLIFEEYLKGVDLNGKTVIKTEVNLKHIGSLKKGNEKKNRAAVIGATDKGARMLSSMLQQSSGFKPRLTLALDEMEKYKKDLKDMDAYFICLSARQAIERLKVKDREVYFLSDYIDEDSMKKIKDFINGQ